MVGDTAQLPPVNTLQSPALDADVLASYGFKLFEIELKEVIRQAKTSGILSNATTLRKNLITDPDSLPRFSTQEFEDVERISGTEIVELIESEYDQYGMDEVKVICRSNKNANI
jgi:exodeoxyribonuclease-5